MHMRRVATQAPGPSLTLGMTASNLGGPGCEAHASCHHPSPRSLAHARDDSEGTWAGGAARHMRRAATRAPGPSLTLGMTARDLGRAGLRGTCVVPPPEPQVPRSRSGGQRGIWAGGAARHMRRATTRAPDPSLTLGMTARGLGGRGCEAHASCHPPEPRSLAHARDDSENQRFICDARHVAA